jgi:hypothetical protein
VLVPMGLSTMLNFISKGLGVSLSIDTLSTVKSIYLGIVTFLTSSICLTLRGIVMR